MADIEHGAAGAGNGASESSKSNGNFSGGDTSTSKSNGNFSGYDKGYQGPSIDLGTEAGPGYARGDFSLGANLGWAPSLSLNGSGDSTNIFTGAHYNADTGITSINGSNTYDAGTSTTASTSSKQLTVDDVWDTGSDKRESGGVYSEKQGDYNASKNETSKVNTSTFGKQSEIVTGPSLKVEDKGLVDNSVIDSVEGLDFTNKDKESQEVLDAKKRQDKAEEEDKSNATKDKILSLNDRDLLAEGDETGTDAPKDFRIGEEVGSKEKQAMDDAETTLNDNKKKVSDTEQKIETLQASKEVATEHRLAADKAVMAATNTINKYSTILMEQLGCELDDKASMAKKGVTYNVEDGTYTYSGKDSSIKSSIDTLNRQTKAQEENDKYFKEYQAAEDRLTKELEAANADLVTYQEELKKSQAAYDEAKQTYDNYFTSAEDVPAKFAYDDDDTGVAYKDGKPVDISTLEEDLEAYRETATDEEYEIAKAILDSHIEARNKLEEAAKKVADFNTASPEDIAALVEAQKKYNQNLKQTLKSMEAIKQTNYNRKFTADIAAANDFEITYTTADGEVLTKSYSQLATEMAEKSPQVAAAMYNAKADQLEEDGHTFLAKINRGLAKMQESWIGSKLGINDNIVREQFIKMAELDMKATYAAYNDVINDETGKYTDEEKANAENAMLQARTLKTAATALQYSTGFLSGIGDGTSDGQFGTTNPDDLNTYQKVLFNTSNVVKTALGLGVTPAANEAFKNFYYMNKEYLKDEETFLNKDWDKDGFAWVEEYSYNTTAQLVSAGSEITVGIVMTATGNIDGVAYIASGIKAAIETLYSIRGDAEEVAALTDEILGWFNDADELEGLPEEAKADLEAGIKQIEDFKLKASEVNNLDSWLEGSGSNTASNEKFNQALTYDEWMKLIESDEVMRKYAKDLASVKENSIN